MDPYVVTKLKLNYGSKDYSTTNVISLSDLADVRGFSEIEVQGLTITLTAAPTFVDQGLFVNVKNTEDSTAGSSNGNAHHVLLTFAISGSMCGELRLTLWSHRLRLTLTCSEKPKMSMQRFEDMMSCVLCMMVGPVLKREASTFAMASENAVLQTHLFVDDIECKSVSLMQVQEKLLSAGLEASHVPNGTYVLVRRGISRLVLYRTGVIQVRTRCLREAEELVSMVSACLEKAIAVGDVDIICDESRRCIAGVQPEKWRRLPLYVHARLHGYKGPFLKREDLKEWVQQNVPGWSGIYLDATLGGVCTRSWSTEDLKAWLLTRGVSSETLKKKNREDMFYIAKCVDIGKWSYSQGQPTCTF